MDDASGDTGDLRGWALRITAEVDLVTVDEQVPADIDQQQSAKSKKKSKSKGKGKRR